MSKLIRRVRKQIIQKFGENTTITPSEDEVEKQMIGDVRFWMPTGIDSLDAALGREKMGIPAGRVLEIYGAEGHGKSSLLYYILGCVQEMDGVAALIDAELSYDFDWAATMGIKHDDLLLFPLSEDSSVEGYFDIITEVVESIRSKKANADIPIVFGWDTPWCTPTYEQMNSKKSYQDTKFRLGVLARSMSTNLPFLNRCLVHNAATLILVNQVRDNIGVVYGDPLRTPGGRAIKHIASIRAQIKRVKMTSAKDGIISMLSNKKNKLSTPFKNSTVIISKKKGLQEQQKKKRKS